MNAAQPTMSDPSVLAAVDCVKWLTISIVIHLTALSLGPTAIVIGSDDEPDSVMVVSPFKPSESVWLDEDCFPHEALESDTELRPDGIVGPDHSVPDIWDPSDQILSYEPRDYGSFEDIDAGGSNANRSGACKCKVVPLGSVTLICGCTDICRCTQFLMKEESP